jgi:hypothetical protein
MKKKLVRYVLLIFLTIALLTGGILGIMAYQFLHIRQTKAMDAIPQNTAGVFTAKKSRDLIRLLRQKPALGNLLWENNNFRRLHILLADIVQQINSPKNTENISAFVALLPSLRQHSVLLLLQTEKRHNRFLRQIWNSIIQKETYDSLMYNNISLIHYQLNRQDIYACMQDGLLIFAFDMMSIRLSINQLQSHVAGSAHYLHTLRRQEESEQFTVWIQHEKYRDYLKTKLQRPGCNLPMERFFEACTFSSLSMKYSDKEVHFNGITHLHRPLLSAHQNSSIASAIRYIPKDAQNVFLLTAPHHQMMKDLPSFIYHSGSFMDLLRPHQMITFDIRTESNLCSVVVLAGENIEQVQLHLLQNVHTRFSDNHYIMDTTYVDSYMIGSIRPDNFIVAAWKDDRHVPKWNYYTVMGDRIIFSDKKDGIIRYIDDFRHKRTLNKNSVFADWEKKFSRQAHIMFFDSSCREGVNSAGVSDSAFFVSAFRLQANILSDTTLSVNMAIRMR